MVRRTKAFTMPHGDRRRIEPITLEDRGAFRRCKIFEQLH
jgi:hypothetical protein